MKSIRLISAAAFAAVGIIGLGSCSALRSNQKPDAVRTADGNATAAPSAGSQSETVRELLGDWTVVDIRGQEVVADAADMPRMGFSLNQENPGWIDFYAFNGCNYINGVVALKGSKIASQGDFAATMKMCAEAPYEMGVSTALEQMASLRIDGINNESFLYLLGRDGQTLMTLRKPGLSALEGAWKVTEVAGTRIPAGVDMEIVIDLQANTIHGNAGCNTLNGDVAPDLDRENGLGFTSLRTTRMTCPDIAYETMFVQALGQVSSFSGDASTVRLLDSAGKTVIVMKRMSKSELLTDR